MRKTVANQEESVPAQQQPLRLLSERELVKLDEDGVVCARGVLSQTTIDEIRVALDDLLDGASVLGAKAPTMAKDGFHGDAFMWKMHDGFLNLALFSPLPRLAEQVLHSKQVNFFYDQFFVKHKGSPIKTPWHQDITFWPVAGDQLISFWITLDPVTRESSGLEFVRASHRWEQRYKAVTPNHDPYLMDSNLPAAPDFGDQRDDVELLGWDMEPGDVLIFGPTICHGSAGNASNKHDRRAVALRYSGDDVVYTPRHATMPLLWDHGLEPGDRLAGTMFPQVRPSVNKHEIEARLTGPEPPSPAAINAFTQQLEDSGF